MDHGAARGFASLLPNTTLLYPEDAEFSRRGPNSWRERTDWVLVKNLFRVPLAWLVHYGGKVQARFGPQQEGPTR